MLTSLLLALAAAQPIPFDAARWTLVGHGATSMPYLERPSLFIDNGVALLRDSSFGDGTIEFDVALHGHASFAGVAFRALSGDDYELIYLRPRARRDIRETLRRRIAPRPAAASAVESAVAE